MEDIASNLAIVPNRKRHGSATSHASAKKKTDVGDIEEKYKGLNVEELRLAIRDGRLCVFLQHKDTDPDPVFPLEYLYWFRPPKNYKPQGNQCLYCMNSFLDVFANKPEYNTVEKVVKAMEDPHFRKHFQALFDLLVCKYKEAGNRNILVRLNNEAPAKAIFLKEIAQVDLEEPDENLMFPESSPLSLRVFLPVAAAYCAFPRLPTPSRAFPRLGVRLPCFDHQITKSRFATITLRSCAPAHGSDVL